MPWSSGIGLLRCLRALGLLGLLLVFFVDSDGSAVSVSRLLSCMLCILVGSVHIACIVCCVLFSSRAVVSGGDRNKHDVLHLDLCNFGFDFGF